MELWISFAFGGLVCGILGYLVGRQRASARHQAPAVAPRHSAPRPAVSVEVKRVALAEGSANVLNALNNRLAAIGALAELLHGSPLDLPMVACPMAQLTEMFTRLLDFSLRRLRDSQPPRGLRIAVVDVGQSL